MSEFNQTTETVPTGETARKDTKRFLIDLLETILLSVALYLAINFVSARVRVDGFSMRPTLEDGEFILVNRLSYQFSEPKRGEIIVFKSPVTPEDLIKRVIGLPGDEVLIRNGTVSINGVALDEPYIAAPPRYNGSWTVEEDTLFVLGDNRNDSSDSHAWGLVPMENVIGKSILIYWPLEEWNLLNHTIITAGIP